MKPTFKDLYFKPHRAGNGIRATMYFINGYGASVIKTSFSYGGLEGLYELAVMKGDEHASRITYETYITDDVIGDLTESQVSELLDRISKLTPTGEKTWWFKVRDFFLAKEN